jgi:hypothetical protein
MSDCLQEVGEHYEGPVTRPFQSRIYVVFLGPKANAELVPKYTPPPQCFTSKFHPKVALHISIKIPPVAASRRLVSKLKVQIGCSKTLLSLLPFRGSSHRDNVYRVFS